MDQAESLQGDMTHSLTVKLNPAKDVPLRNLRQDAQGWYLFVNENWIPSLDEEEDRKRRHHLMERWAGADQAYRDGYDQQAKSKGIRLWYQSSPLTKKTLGRFVCIAPVDRANHAANYRHLVKILICCYFTGGFGGEHVLQRAVGRVPEPQIPTIMTTSTTSCLDASAEDNALPSAFLKEADFRAISMTHNGSAFFSGCVGIWFIIDQTDLDTGRMTLVSFNPDGTARDHIKLRPWNIAYLVIRYTGLAWPLSRLIFEELGGGRSLNQPMDMDIPLLDLLETTHRYEKSLGVPGLNREQWAEEIERNAPGYLELESQGREVEFELSQLRPIDG